MLYPLSYEGGTCAIACGKPLAAAARAIPRLLVALYGPLGRGFRGVGGSVAGLGQFRAWRCAW